MTKVLDCPVPEHRLYRAINILCPCISEVLSRTLDMYLSTENGPKEVIEAVTEEFPWINEKLKAMLLKLIWDKYDYDS